MDRWFLGVLVIAAVPGLVFGQTEYPIFAENFESGLGAWTVLSYDAAGGVNNNSPVVFDSTGAGIYGANSGYPGSQSVGFSSNLSPWDGQQPQWIEIQWPGLLAPGVYDVVIVVDRYVYLDDDEPPNGPGDDDPYGIGERIYVLTDGKYDNPVMNYDGDMGADGARWSKWSNKEIGIWEIGAIKRAQDIQTTTGNVELRLLFHEKYAHYNTVAWDNLTLSLRQPGGAIVFTYPAGTAGTLTTRTDADNGVVTLGAGHGLQPNDMVDVSWVGPAGSGGIRRMTVSSVSGNDVTVSATVGASDALPAQDTAVVVNKPEDFEDGLAGWTAKLWGGGVNNDTPQTFTSADPDLYWNVNNPGTTSAGFSSNMEYKDFTSAAWMQQQFPVAVTPGTYDVKFEYDAYVYRYPAPNYDEFELFAGPSGTGIYGPNTGYPGSQSVGVSYDPPTHDGTQYIWIQQLHPAAVPADPDLGTTYDVRLEGDVYVYLENGSGQWQSGSLILFLTDDKYDKPEDLNPDGDVSPGFRKSTWNHESAGTWLHIDQTAAVTTKSGNIEVRLLAWDKMQVAPGEFTIAWDNIKFTVSEAGGGPVVYTIEDDFELGYDDWTVKVRNTSDPWGAGNRMYVLTDDQYDQRWWDFDHGDRGLGFSLEYWPGRINDVTDWSLNGVWQHVIHETQMTTLTGNIEVRLLHHDKNSGAQAVAWDNLSLTFTTIPPPCGQLRFDRDADGDVDHADFALLQLCYTGDGNAMLDQPACFCFDTDNDLDVDQADLLAFEGCASGPGVVADETCDDSLPPAVP